MNVQMKKNPKKETVRHASPQTAQTDLKKPPAEGTTPNTPCSIASEQVEHLLRLDCQRKFNKMKKNCCCDLGPEDSHLPHLDSLADVSNLNTASNGNGGVLPEGNQQIWEVGTLQQGGQPKDVTNWAPAFVTSEPGAWTDAGEGTAIPDADWISTDVNQGNGNAVQLYFRLRFILCEDIDSNGFVLTAKVLADNSLQAIYVNGVALGGIPVVGFSSSPVEIEIGQNWKPCVNEIVFQVQNDGGPTGFLAQFEAEAPANQAESCESCKCSELELPNAAPCFNISWGDSACDCLESNDFEVLCITACNCFSNIAFQHLTIHQIVVVDDFGLPVPNLPDGTPSVDIVPYGPICFDDLGPCIPGQTNCKSRQVVLYTRGAIAGKYKLRLTGICYQICYTSSTEACFEFNLCKD